MKRRYLYGLGLLSAMVVLGSAVPAMAAARTRQAPDISVSWSFGPSSPFNATRFDGAYIASLNRVYFLGFRTDNDATDGSVWYLDLATSTYTDTGVDMPIPISNYQIAGLTDSHGFGLYIFGGRNAQAQIVK